MSLQIEIQQSRPPSSLEEETLLNLLRTSDCLSRTFQRQIRPWGISATQYNVLRILRGAQPKGLPCAELGRRMITADPDITRLLGRLKALKLIRQRRDPHDRRVLHNHIAGAGLALLAEMDGTVKQLPLSLLGHMSATKLERLCRLLEEARRTCCKEANLSHEEGCD